jgi:hypothetical protein
VTAWWQADTDTQLAVARGITMIDAWRATVGGAMSAIVGVQPSATHNADVWSRSGLPARGVTVVTAGDGDSGLRAGSDPGPFAVVLLDAGQQVIAVEAPAVAGNVLVANRNAAAYTFGYNPPLVAERAGRVVAALAAARKAAAGRPVTLVALDAQSTAWAALAASSAPDLVDRAAFVTEGFRFASATSMEDAAFLPGSVKYGDLPAMLGVLAPKPVWVAGETATTLAMTTGIYRAAGATHALALSRARGALVRRDLVKWITDRRD